MCQRVSQPRQVLPGQFYMLTRRCAQRMFLLRPDDATNNAFIYCLALAASKFGIDVLFTLAESNHHHTIIFDRYGHVSAFLEHFHKLVARSQNALRGRWENFWAAQEPCITRLLDRDAVIEKLIYAASNPVKDRLVERVHHWPGVNTWSAFIHRRSINATRPRHFFRSSMPAEVTLDLVIPPELGAPDDVVREVRAGVEAIEERMRSERMASGASVIGRRRLLAQSWKECPESFERRRERRPRFAGATHVRVPALESYRSFLWAYKYARDRWRRGLDAVFPPGTYWLSRFALVQVAPT
jgi:putative transposase